MSPLDVIFWPHSTSRDYEECCLPNLLVLDLKRVARALTDLFVFKISSVGRVLFVRSVRH